MKVTNKNSNINILAEKDIITFDEIEAEKIVLPESKPGFNTQLTFNLTSKGIVLHQVMVGEPEPRDPRFEHLLREVLVGEVLIINWNIQEVPK